MSNQQIAQTIIEQLGNGRFVAMTGAKLFIAINDGLSFRLPSRFAVKGINAVRITLNAADLYDVEFLKVHGAKEPKQIASAQNVYAEDLRTVFEQETGLFTYL